ncbi:DUF3060 domain-containing protein [Curtobacterium sp. USHLN213]|uniref:DUF3060 domain-containing protein n=1 Tax=Curtobacterium sp. USHLN213 TaxID=3081255 RepID=UPI0030199435
MRPNRFLLPVITATVIVAALAGCAAGGESKSSSSADAAKPSPTATVLPADEIRVPDTKADAECVDGQAVIDQSGAEVTLQGACEKVTVSGSDSIVHLGAVDVLIVQSSLTRVTVEDAGTVTVLGNGNDVLFGGEEPESISDKGQQNIIEAQAE